MRSEMFFLDLALAMQGGRFCAGESEEGPELGGGRRSDAMMKPISRLADLLSPG